MTFWLILGGVATALAFPLQPDPTRDPWALWPLAWVGLTPLLVSLLRTASVRSTALSAMTFASAWFFIDCIWIFRVFDVYGWVLIWIPIMWITLFGVLAHFVRRAGLSPWWSWPALWIAIEFIRSEWSPIRLDWFSDALDPLRFSWLVLGHSRVTAPIAAQTADIWGGYGLSLAPFLFNLALATFLVSRPRSLAPALATIALIAAEFGYGAWQYQREPRGETVVAGVVQSERESLTALLELSEKLVQEAPEVRIIVWPEESFSEKLGDISVVQAFGSQHNVTMVIGVEHVVENGPYENRAYVLMPDRAMGLYRKRERVPFVERHTPSQDAPTFPMNIGERTLTAGVLICYDADFPTTARELTQNGAQILLMPTLDEGGWGGSQHVQHALLPRLRAIENRRPVVQAATSGVSQIIDDRGRVLAEIPYRLNRRPDRPTLFHEGTAHAAVHPNATLSFYTLRGQWFGPGVAAIAAVALLCACSISHREVSCPSREH